MASPTDNFVPPGLPSTIDTHLVRVFDGLHVAGAVGFVLILISALLSRANRHYTWFSFCIAWITYSLSSCMLFLAGHTFDPSPTLCVTQAAIVYAAPPIMASTTLSLVIHLLLTIRGRKPGERMEPHVRPLLLIAPWIVWVTVLLSLLVAGIQNPQNVTLSPGGTYCILNHSVLPKIAAFVTEAALITFISVECTVIYLLIKSRRDITTGFSQSTALSIRMFIFTLVGIALVVTTFIYTFSPGHSLISLDIFMAAISPCAVVVFGSQSDLLRVWIFWRKFPSTTTSPPAPTDSPGEA